jgi:hypothetical protein
MSRRSARFRAHWRKARGVANGNDPGEDSNVQSPKQLIQSLVRSRIACVVSKPPACGQHCFAREKWGCNIRATIGGQLNGRSFPSGRGKPGGIVEQSRVRVASALRRARSRAAAILSNGSFRFAPLRNGARAGRSPADAHREGGACDSRLSAARAAA